MKSPDIAGVFRTAGVLFRHLAFLLSSQCQRVNSSDGADGPSSTASVIFRHLAPTVKAFQGQLVFSFVPCVMEASRRCSLSSNILPFSCVAASARGSCSSGEEDSVRSSTEQ